MYNIYIYIYLLIVGPASFSVPILFLGPGPGPGPDGTRTWARWDPGQEIMKKLSRIRSTCLPIKGNKCIYLQR